MTLHITKNTPTVIENGIYRFALANYPHISASERSRLRAFVAYEELHGRQTEVLCDDEKILIVINQILAPSSFSEDVPVAENAFVYHATGLNAAKKILSGDKLLSAARGYGKTGAELAYEKRNSPWNDPADYFEYIMFCWGDNMTGDYVVLSESFPAEEDLQKGNYNPGIRFYFRYEDMLKHPGHAFDGYHPIKIKDEINLPDYLHACVVPQQYQVRLDGYILPELAPRVTYLSQHGLGLTEWNQKVVEFISR